MSGRLAELLRSWVLPTALFAAITVGMTFPLIRVAGSAFPHDAGDPSLNTWLLWWSTEHVPLTARWWSAPMFYPMADAMALSELLIGLLPITAPVQWLTGNPLLAYNCAFLLSFVLSGLAAYWLALELTGRRAAAVLAGLAFAFGPYRMNQLSHIQMMAYFWAPIALLGLHRYVGARGLVWLAVFAGAWLMQALSNGYALFHLSILVVLWLIWFVRDVRKLILIGVAWALAALPLVPALLEYRAVHDRLHLARDINEIERFSVDLAGFLSAPPDLAIWGSRMWPSQFETACFPGATVAIVLLAAGVLTWCHRSHAPQSRSPVRTIAWVVALGFALVAVSALIFGPWAVGSAVTVGNFHKPFSLAVLAGLIGLMSSTWWRRAWIERSMLVFYVAAGVTMYMLALGPAPALLGRQILYEPPYAWLMRLPGFDALRVPARFGMLALLCQAIVIALVFARWSDRLPIRSVAAALIALGMLGDGWIRLPVVAAPKAAPSVDWRAAGVMAVVELPPGEPIVDFPAFYRSMSHRRPLVNGFSGFAPPHYLPLVYAIGHGQLGALHELAAAGAVGAAVDRSLPWHEDLERFLETLPGTKRLTRDDRWATFIVSGLPPTSVRLGQKLTPVSVRANRQAQDVARMIDRDIESAWGPGTPQDGHEEVIVELESAQTVGAVVLSMGAYSFGFPREVAIDVSADGREWETVWQGETSVATVRAALRDPATVPVTFDLGSSFGKLVRVRQVGQDPTVPWWIAELDVYGPSP